MVYLIVGICLGSVATAGIFVLIFHHKIFSDARSITFEKESDSSEDNIDLYKDIATAMEHQSILNGYNIHDDTGPILSNLSLNLEFFLKSDDPEIEKYKEKFQLLDHETKELSDSIRRVIFGMLPTPLEKGDLNSAIKEYSLKYNGFRGKKVSVHITGEAPFISFEYKTNIFRITQQLIFNALKHSSGWNIEVLLLWTMDYVKLIVKDDGQGIQQAKPGGENHGIRGIEFRARLMGATFKKPNEGSEFELIVPLKQQWDESQ